MSYACWQLVCWGSARSMMGRASTTMCIRQTVRLMYVALYWQRLAKLGNQAAAAVATLVACVCFAQRALS